MKHGRLSRRKASLSIDCQGKRQVCQEGDIACQGDRRGCQEGDIDCQGKRQVCQEGDIDCQGKRRGCQRKICFSFKVHFMKNCQAFFLRGISLG